MLRRRKVRIGPLFVTFTAAILTLDAPLNAQRDAVPDNAKWTSQVWDLYAKGAAHRTQTVALAQKVIQQYGQEAAREQRDTQALIDAGSSPALPAGVAGPAMTAQIYKNGPLNDVATCLFIVGKLEEDNHDLSEARAAFNKATQFSWARCWDTKGWFWSPAEAAAAELKTTAFRGPSGTFTVTVLGPGGAPLGGVPVVESADFTGVVTNARGVAAFSLPAATASASACITIDHVLWAGDSGTAQIHPGDDVKVAIRLARISTKPPSTGPVRIEGRRLVVDGRRFEIKGFGYEPYAIGTQAGWQPGAAGPAIYRRDFSVLQAMGGNCARTWGQMDDSLPRIAAEHAIRVIAGFWVPYEVNLREPAARANLLAQFRAYVSRYKADPAILMWSIGNEQNYHNGSGSDWYTLVNEMAWEAFDEEGASYHPVTTPNGELKTIGDASRSSDDARMSCLDAWGANIYRGASFGALFTDYAALSKKPFWISEFGVDAYDNRINSENEALQSGFDAGLWNEIAANRDTCSGGTIMAFVDQWWKNGADPSAHTPGGPRMGSDPDGVFDEAYWGAFSIEKSPTGGVDQIRARRVVSALKSLWTQQPPN